MSKNEISRMSRRTFLTATAVPAVASVPMLRAAVDGPALARSGGAALAINGGKPVRTTSLSTGFPGTQFYDEQEKTGASEAVESRSLFRWYGPNKPQNVASFEREFAQVLGVKYVLAVTSGTAALHCALTALNLGPGDEVILPAWTWLSCYNAILLTGALPVFAEVDESFNLDPEDLEKRITPQTKAIMVVHLFGAPADMDRIMAVARKHNLKVLEDSAQCAGGQYKGRRTSTIGDIGIFSFQIHKMITAGEGGAVITNDPLLYERAVRFHDLGQLRQPTQAQLGKGAMPYFVGVNYRMNEMTGAVMRAQLRKLETILAAHRRKCQYVKDQVRTLPGIRLRRSYDPQGGLGITVDLLLPHQELRDQFLKAMTAENVPMERPSAAIILPVLPYIENKAAPHAQWPTFNSPRGKQISYGAECCPRTLDIFNRAATLTIGPRYKDADLNDIVAATSKVYTALLT